MSKLCKLSKNPEVNLNRLRKAVAHNDHTAVQFLWKHVDVAHHAADLLEIAAQHSDQKIVAKILDYVDINSQQFYDAFTGVVDYPVNPYWQAVFPLFLETAVHKTKASFLVNYLVFAQHLRPDVVAMTADSIKSDAHTDLFTVLAKKSAQNNRTLALQSIWPYCNPKIFFDKHPLSTWSTHKSDTFDFLSDEFAKVQKDVLLQHVGATAASLIKKM